MTTKPINRPEATIITAGRNGRYTFRVTNPAWSVAYTYRKTVDTEEAAKENAAEFLKFFNEYADLMEQGRVRPSPIMSLEGVRGNFWVQPKSVLPLPEFLKA